MESSKSSYSGDKKSKWVRSKVYSNLIEIVWLILIAVFSAWMAQIFFDLALS